MTDDTGVTTPNPWAAIAVGLAAGLVASFAMDQFQAAVAKLSGSDSDAAPATERAADGVARAMTGHPIPAAQKPMAGQAVHYLLGAGLGIAYAVAAEYRPAVTTGYGTAFAVGTAAALDEVAVPAVGLGDAPWKTPASTHAYSLASHLVFGSVIEAVRRVMGRLLTPARSSRVAVE